MHISEKKLKCKICFWKLQFTALPTCPIFYFHVIIMIVIDRFISLHLLLCFLPIYQMCDIFSYMRGVHTWKCAYAALCWVRLWKRTKYNQNHKSEFQHKVQGETQIFCTDLSDFLSIKKVCALSYCARFRLRNQIIQPSCFPFFTVIFLCLTYISYYWF